MDAGVVSQMSVMIEKMARAIFERDYLGTFKVDNGELERVWQQESSRRSLAFDQARAALTALEEPTDEMEAAALEEAGFPPDTPWQTSEWQATMGPYYAMIAAAKGGRG